MRDLSNIKTAEGRLGSRGSHRGNMSASRAGSAILGNKPSSSYSNYREGGGLEPSLKDKIVRD